MPEQTDLFGFKPAQGSLFGEEEGRMALPQPKSDMPDPTDVRRRLHALLLKARQARSMPWPEREARMWQIVFPNMANWLPEKEAEQLRLEFRQEIERLKSAA